MLAPAAEPWCEPPLSPSQEPRLEASPSPRLCQTASSRPLKAAEGLQPPCSDQPKLELSLLDWSRLPPRPSRWGHRSTEGRPDSLTLPAVGDTPPPLGGNLGLVGVELSRARTLAKLCLVLGLAVGEPALTLWPVYDN